MDLKSKELIKLFKLTNDDLDSHPMMPAEQIALGLSTSAGTTIIPYRDFYGNLTDYYVAKVVSTATTATTTVKPKNVQNRVYFPKQFRSLMSTSTNLENE